MGYRDIFKTALERKRAVKPAAWALIPLAVLLLAWGGARRYSAVKGLAAAKKADAARFIALEEEYLGLKAAYDEVANRAFLSGAESTVSVIEGLAGGVGVKDRITGLKPLEETETLGYVDSKVEARLKGVDLNQLVNLLFRIENHRALLVVRAFSMKSTFEDPELYEITMTISHIVKKQ